MVAGGGGEVCAKGVEVNTCCDTVSIVENHIAVQLHDSFGVDSVEYYDT